jgi:hypothetical protein
MTTKTLLILAGCVVAAVSLVAFAVNGSRKSTTLPVEGTAAEIVPEPSAEPESPPPADDSPSPTTETATFALG